MRQTQKQRQREFRVKAAAWLRLKSRDERSAAKAPCRSAKKDLRCKVHADRTFVLCLFLPRFVCVSLSVCHFCAWSEALGRIAFSKKLQTAVCSWLADALRQQQPPAITARTRARSNHRRIKREG